MTGTLEPEDDGPIDASAPPAWWLACARGRDEDRHTEPNTEQDRRDAEPRAFAAPVRSPGSRR